MEISLDSTMLNLVSDRVRCFRPTGDTPSIIRLLMSVFLLTLSEDRRSSSVKPHSLSVLAIQKRFTTRDLLRIDSTTLGSLRH